MATKKEPKAVAKSLIEHIFEYLGYLGIVLGIVGIVLLLLKILGVFLNES